MVLFSVKYQLFFKVFLYLF